MVWEGRGGTNISTQGSSAWNRRKEILSLMTSVISLIPLQSQPALGHLVGL
jgi:hypothetical protein